MFETKKYFIFLGLFSFIALIILVGTWKSSGKVGGAYIEAPLQFPIGFDRNILIPRPKPGITSLELSARAVVVSDRLSGLVLLEKNPLEILPIASLTKLMTAILVRKLVGLDEIVEISPQDLETVQYRINLVSQERMAVIDLLRAMLVSSANDATLALARSAGGSVEKFVAAMNEEAKILGMENTAFQNPVGFDDPGHYSTAADLIKLVESFLQYPELQEIVKLKSTVIRSVDDKFKHYLNTTNKLMLSHADIVGLKTGYTTEAKGNLIILVDNKNPNGETYGYYLLILGSDDREGESEKIMNWVKENFVWAH